MVKESKPYWAHSFDEKKEEFMLMDSKGDRLETNSSLLETNSRIAREIKFSRKVGH